MAAAVLLLGVPATSRADDAPRTDPEVGSPAEAVYGIPFEEARRDAAPGTQTGPAIRTENQVGSSSVVPGRGRDPSATPPEIDPERLAERRRERRLRGARAAERLSGETSPVATGLLVVLLVAIAAYGGVAAGRLLRPSERMRP